MKLNSDALNEVNEVLALAQEIQQMTTQIHGEEDLTAQPILQNALMFCLKGIGFYIDKAARYQELNFSEGEMPEKLFFWKHMHFLRNALVHHFDQQMLNGSYRLAEGDVRLLYEICCRKIGQLIFYLQLLVTKPLDQINFGGQKFKIFHDFRELSSSLKIQSPRELRGQASQSAYVQALLDGTAIIYQLAHDKTKMEDILSMKERKKPHYYAIQNILECISTLGNPNPYAVQLINDCSRGALFGVEPRAEQWLRRLGVNRNLMHQNFLFDDNAFLGHIQEMCLLRGVLLDPKLQQTSLGARFSDKINPQPSQQLSVPITLQPSSLQPQGNRKWVELFTKPLKKQENSSQSEKNKELEQQLTKK